MPEASCRFQGIPVSGGIAIGTVHLIERHPMELEPYRLTQEQVDGEVERFLRAVEMTADEISALRKRVAESIDERQASIFDAHLAMLSDPLIVDTTLATIRSDQLNAEYVFQRVVDGVAERMAQIHDEFFSLRNNDLFDVSRRVLTNLICLNSPRLDEIQEEAILVTHDLGPADTAQLMHSKITGFCTNLGGQTSHTAIMAKALRIPAVLGLDSITHHARNGDQMILDGSTGVVIVRPTQDDLDAYQHRLRQWRFKEQQLAALRNLPATTLDGQRITLLANIELPEEAGNVHEHGAEGIGLFRTEFIYLNRESLPSENEQYLVYAQVHQAVAPHMVVFRTLDLGGDKFFSATPIEELNPFLGLRALRLCMENPEVFRAQLRAMFRAGSGKTLHILFPMVTGLEDFRAAKTFMDKVRAELDAEGIEPPRELKIGIMIETPSAALTSDSLASEVDFFSIGTNDLVQYTLAVDRVNKRVAYLYEPLHPAVLRLIELVVCNARAHQIPVAVCGEMAAEPAMAALLVGLGIRELSMGPVSIPAVKSLLRKVRVADLEQLARVLLSLPTATLVRARLEQHLGELLQTEKRPLHVASRDSGGC